MTAPAVLLVQRRLRWLAVGVAFVLWAAVAWFAPAAMRQVDERGTDLVWQLTADPTEERRVVVVDIDDASLQRIGPWPWPRETQAKLVTALRERGASLQMYDIVFADGRPGTGELAKALAATRPQAPAVLAQVFSIDHESRQQTGELTGALPGQGCLPPAAPAQGFVANVAGLETPAGHITPRLDRDGAVRRVPALVCFGERNYPALAIAGPLALDGGDSAVPVRTEPGTRPWDPPWMLTLGGTTGWRIPLDANGDMRVPYRKARSGIISISAADVLEGKLSGRNVLSGAWVLIGASAFGLADAVPTALGGAVSGVEVHAQLLTGLLDESIPFTPRAAMALQAGWVAIAALVLLALCWTRGAAATRGGRLQRRHVLWIPVAGLSLGAAGFGLHALALLTIGWWIGWSNASLAIVLLGLCLGVAEHARSLAEKGRLFQNLSSYLPATVAEKIALLEPTGDIAAERRDVTVVVADVRNFSAYCETRSPEDAARVLHRFYTTAENIIEAHGGTVEEMTGDSLIAVFNGSKPCAEHPAQALTAARELWLRCSEELPNVPPQGLEPLGLGVGVESGTALVGSFGPASRRVHTVLGQPITVAMRLQEMTPELAYPILVGAETTERVGVPFERHELALKPLGTFLLPGLRHSSKVFTLRSLVQPGSDAEQQSLQYLKQQGHLAA
jgi:adenylate cyclase